MLDAASALIVDKGFASMTVAEVGRRADAAKGTVYLYFDSKLAILDGLRDRYRQNMLDIVDRALEEDDTSWTARLERLIEDLVAFAVESSDLYDALFHDTPSTASGARGPFATALAEFLAPGVDAGEFDITEPGFTAAFLAGAMHGVTAELIHAKPARRREMVQALRTLTARCAGVGT